MIDKLIAHSDTVEDKFVFMQVSEIKDNIIYIQKNEIIALKAIKKYW